MRFLNPVALVLVLVLPLAVWLALRSLTGITGLRRAVAVGLRLAILSLLVMALGQAVLVKRHDELCVLFLTDRSDSIPAEQQDAALQIVNALCGKMAERDRAGLVVFGGNASIEVPPVRSYATLAKTTVESVLRREQTDLAGAMQLALAAFPENVQRRLVLISDGNQNRGDVLVQARSARASSTDVWVLPYKFEYPQEVLVDKVTAPAAVKQSEPFEVRAVVTSTDDGQAALRLYQDDQLVATEQVTLRAGKNVFAVPRQLHARGFYTFRAIVESPLDTLTQNNEGCASTVVHGQPRVLVVEGQPGEAKYLVGFLRKDNIEAEVIGVGAMPGGIGRIQSYDALVLVNVPAFDLTRNQMRAIESAVRDFGTGLVMIGGDRAFGAGGYQNTPVENALPVTMEVKQKKIMPNGALAMVLHTCEIPDGNTWAIEIGKEAVNVLSTYDMVGVLAYDWRGGGDTWSIPLQVIGSKARIFGLLGQIAPGDMPAFNPSLTKALSGLKACKAASRHIVVISDGDPSPPTPGLVKAIASAGISVSTVMIAPHGVSNYAVMQGLAMDTNGRFYDVKTASDLPRIFIKEALMVRRSLIFEKRFRPRIASRAEPLYGLSGPMPDLLGYVTTTPKDRARVPLVGDPPNKDPILAQWRYGLGKAAAYTSDAKNRWAAEWVTWAGFGKFWTQLVRWSMRSVPQSDLTIRTHLEQGQGRISADAMDAEGGYRSLLTLRAEVVSPKLERQTVDLLQSAPGHYEGRFAADEVGAYLVRVSALDKQGSVSAMQVTGLAVSYSPEYRDLSTNYPLLHAIARESGGRIMGLKDNVFGHDPEGHAAAREIWWGLALAALLIFPLDVAVRRLVVDLAPLRRLLGRLGGLLLLPLRRRAQGEAQRDQVMERLRARKAATQATRPSQAPTPPQVEAGQEQPTLTGEPDQESAADRSDGQVPEETASEGEADAAADYTRRLLEAKKRALRGKKPRSEE